MKKILLTLASLSILFSSCSNDDENSTPSSNASTDISFQASGFQGDTNSRKALNGIDGVDSVIVAVDSIVFNVSGEEIVFVTAEGEGYIDLMTFETKDTLIWTNQTIPVGHLEDEGMIVLYKDAPENRVIKSDDTEKDLHISHAVLDFRLLNDSETEIEEGDQYIIKFDMANSLRLVSNQGGERYNLQQGTAGAEKYGTIELIKISEDDN